MLPYIAAMPCHNVSISVICMQRCVVLLVFQLCLKEDACGTEDIDHSLVQICSHGCNVPCLPAVVQMTHLHVSWTSCIISYTSAHACLCLPWRAQALLLSRIASCQHSSADVSGYSSSTQTRNVMHHRAKDGHLSMQCDTMLWIVR